jgi:hypothetical protein
MWFFQTKLDIDKSLFVKIKPKYVGTGSKLVTDKQKQMFFKSKIDTKYVFGVDTYSFKIKTITINATYVIYELKYTSKTSEETPLSRFKAYISDGFHKETHAGDPKVICKGVGVLVNAKNVEVYQ